VLSTYEKFSGVCFEMFNSSIPYTWRSEYRTQINSSHWVTKSVFPLSNDIYIYIYIYQELACCPTELFLVSDTSNVRRVCCDAQRSGFHGFSKKAMMHLNSRCQIVTLSGFHTEEPQILGSTAQNVVAGHILCFVLFRLCIFFLICFVCTSVRTTATEWKLNYSK